MTTNKKLLLLLVVVVTMLFPSCRWDIWGSKPSDYGVGTGTIGSSYLYNGETPQFVKATQARYSDKIQLSWNAVTGADYYEVTRAETPSPTTPADELSWKRLLEAPMGITALTDTDVVAGKTYAYRVRARSLALKTLVGDYSQPVIGWLLSAPVEFAASQGTSSQSIDLSWSQVNNIQGYRIYYSNTGYSNWQVAIPKGLEVYDYIFSPNVLSFSFSPDASLLGQSIYFYIQCVSKSGDVSKESIQRLGYTYVQGAPAAPQNFVASRGDSPSEIVLSWKTQFGTGTSGAREDYDWEVYRKAEGLSEKKIYSTRDGDAMPSENADVMSIVDSNSLEAGINYTYSIRAIGKKKDDSGLLVYINGLPSTTDGFLLSPPMDITNIALTPGKGGFTFTIGDALGVAENPSWTYTVMGKSNAEGAQWVPLIGMEAIAVTDTAKRTVTTVYKPTDSDPEHAYEYFTMVTNNGALKSLRYDQVAGKPIAVSRPVAADAFNASDNTVVGLMTANSDGIYPVALTMLTDTTVRSYNVRIWDHKPDSAQATPTYSASGMVATSLANANGQASNSSVLIPQTHIPPIGTQWYYSIQGVDALGRTGDWSDVDSGYGAITGNVLVRNMQVYCLKPWEYLDTKYLTTDYSYGNDINAKWKKSGIYGKIAQAGTGSLSDGITEYSYYNSGTIKYVATVQGLGGRVSFSYNKFGEVPYMHSTGSYVMVVSMSGSGSCDGGITIGGMYPATVGFGNISVSSQKFVGSYTISQSNGTEAEQVSPNQT